MNILENYNNAKQKKEKNLLLLLFHHIVLQSSQFQSINIPIVILTPNSLKRCCYRIENRFGKLYRLSLAVGFFRILRLALLAVILL